MLGSFSKSPCILHSAFSIRHFGIKHSTFQPSFTSLHSENFDWQGAFCIQHSAFGTSGLSTQPSSLRSLHFIPRTSTGKARFAFSFQHSALQSPPTKLTKHRIMVVPFLAAGGADFMAVFFAANGHGHFGGDNACGYGNDAIANKHHDGGDKFSQ